MIAFAQYLGIDCLLDWDLNTKAGMHSVKLTSNSSISGEFSSNPTKYTQESGTVAILHSLRIYPQILTNISDC
jgi:hypothetical protein